MPDSFLRITKIISDVTQSQEGSLLSDLAGKITESIYRVTWRMPLLSSWFMDKNMF